MINVAENVSLKAYNSFGIDVTARYFAEFSTSEELADLLDFTTEGPLILGGGCNVLFKGNIDCLVLRNAIGGIELLKEDADHVYLRVGAGESWHGFVEHCLGRNLAGIENLSLIPGSVGAAPMQNIGAFGVEIKETFHELQAWSLDDHKVHHFSLNDCEFGYRESVFKGRLKGRFIILNVTFRLNKIPRFHTEYGAIKEELEKMNIAGLSIQAISEAVIRIRRSKLPDPAVIGNAGSFFKNPTVSNEKFNQLKEAFPGIIGYPNADTNGVKLFAGWLIEQCGWKGYRKGDAGCHVRHALVLVNYGNATGREVFDLSEEILQSVKGKFGVELEREVNVV